WPSFLPDQKHFLVWVLSDDKQNEGVYAGTLASGDLRLILPVRSRAQYAGGYLFFGRQGNLMAQRFDPDKLELSGDAIRVAEGLGGFMNELADMAFSVSASGNVAWWGGRPRYAENVIQPTWLDRTGHAIGTLGEPGYYLGLMPSPDGKYAATETMDYRALTSNILLLDLAGGNPSRLTFVNYWAGEPLWSADSQLVILSQGREYLDSVSIQGGAAAQTPFPGGTSSDFPLSWAPDGENVLVQRTALETGLDLWVIQVNGDHK